MTATIFSAFIVLIVLNLFARVGPLFFGQWLCHRPWVKKLAAEFPCMILVLLTLYELDKRSGPGTKALVASLLGIGATLLVHRWKRQTTLSIAAGVITYSLLVLSPQHLSFRATEVIAERDPLPEESALNHQD